MQQPWYERWFKVGSVAAALACAVLFSLAAQPTFAQGITNTLHNLGSAGPGPNKVTGSGATGTAEICVFCHTPHGANTNAAAPLWNKALPPTASYSVYDNTNSSTIDGSVLTPGSVSIACLSCHDGTQAMDNIINAPGSGGYSATGGGPTGLGYTWDTTSGRIDADGKMIGGVDTGGTNIALIGTNLKNDHPIGIQYCGGGITGAPATPGAATGTCVDGDFKQPLGTTINSQPVFWVDTGTTDTLRKRNDMILYTRDFSGATGPSVECATCHDPHVSTGQTGPASTTAGETFLRISNASSAVCLACHVK